MFTGIVEELGAVKSLAKAARSARLTIESKVCASDAKIGDSISINGACLTVVDVKGKMISFDVSTETLNRSNLAKLRAGDRANVERSLRADSRLGGHFVTGHIDCTGKIVSKKLQGEFIKFEIEIPRSITAYLVEKGPICVDGISLTINGCSHKSFTVMLIPHTLSATTLDKKQTGDYLNIEADILAKYLEKLTSKSRKKPTSPEPTNITKKLLKEHGFI